MGHWEEREREKERTRERERERARASERASARAGNERERGAMMITTQQLFQEKFIVCFSKVPSISGGSFRVAWGHIRSSI